MMQYAPKDKQPDSLCDDPQSVCDAAYGFSIGRGSFQWTKGGWTTVQQCVTLNTPGEHDGSFTLDVNGARVIDRGDIFYRSAPSPADSDSDSRPQGFIDKPEAVGAPPGKKKNEGGLLGSLLGGLLRRKFGLGGGRRPREVQSTFNPTPVSFALQQSATDEEEEEARPIGFIGLFFRYVIDSFPPWSN
jgi:hypothetical protein